MPEIHATTGGPLSRDVPFPGLRPYEEADANWFFGRSGEINDLLKRLRRLHFIAIVGASGCGKSSLVRAGLLPHIRHGFLSAKWQIAIFRPGDRPVANLAEALGPGFVSDPNDPDNVLRSSQQGLVRAVQRTQSAANAKVLILVDQFEELFQFAQRTGETGQEEVKEFLKLLLTASASDDVEVYVVLTMRLEWLNECASYLGLAEAINAGIYLVPQMQRRQFGQAILGPLEAADGSLESALFDRMLNDLDNKTDQLPVLQHALLRLWERGGATDTLDIAGYEEIGTLSKCLSAHAEEVYGELTERQRHVAEMLFRSITQVSKNRKIRRALPIGEVMKSTGVGFEELAVVILAFSKAGRSFLVTTQGELTPASIVDISHEALIRQWKALDEWVDLEADKQARLRRLDEDAADWNTDRRRMKACLYSAARLERAEELEPVLDANGLAATFLKESRRAQFWNQARRRSAIGFAVLLVIGLPLGAMWQNQRATQRQAENESRLIKAQQEKDSAYLNSVVQQIKQANGSETELAAIAQNIQAQKVYLHYAPGSDQLAGVLKAKLSNNGFTVPGLDLMAPGAVKPQTQVGYYYSEDRADALRIASLVGQQVSGGIGTQLLQNPKTVVPRGQFEVSVVAPPVPLVTQPVTVTTSVPSVTPPPVVSPVASAPKLIADLSAPNIQQGQTVTLTWDAENASEVQLGGVGPVGPRGSRALSPKQSTTYTLTARGDGGTAEKSLSVVVTPVPVSPVLPTATPLVVPAISDLSQVKSTLDRYRMAYESEVLTNVEKVFPKPGKEHESHMKSAFNNYNVIRLNLGCRDEDVHIAGPTATVTCVERFTYTQRGKQLPEVSGSATFRLKRTGSDWIIDEIN